MQNEAVCGRANIMDVINKGEIYLTFVFDGMDSTQLGVASVTDGNTYDTPIVPAFSDNSLEVDGYDGRYYFNTRLTQKDFTYNCFIDHLSAFDFDQLKSWIRPQKIGKLIRPEEPYRYYWVKVSSVDNLGNIPLEHPDTGGVSYTGNFSVTFSTVGEACGRGMFYYQNDLEYYEYRDIFDGTQDYYYDAGLLYKEETLPLDAYPISSGTYPIRIYNPGTYASKLKLTFIPDGEIPSGVLSLTNETVGDRSVISLTDIHPYDRIEIDWAKNEYTLNTTTDYTENVYGDIIFLQPRNYVERLEHVSVTHNGIQMSAALNLSERQVRTEDIGKTIMLKDNSYGDERDRGFGGRIEAIDVDTNSFLIEAGSMLQIAADTTAVLTILDDLVGFVSIPEGVTITMTWQIEPRYL